MLATMAFGLKQARETVSDAAEMLAGTAADTKAAVLGVALLAGVALIVASVALVIAAKGRQA